MLFRRKHSDEIVIPAPGLPVVLDFEAEAEIRDLLAGDQKIAAIKRLRELTDLNLRDAKRFVDAMDAGLPIAPAEGVDTTPIVFSPQVESEIRRLIAEGKMIHAIKFVREQTGLGLRDAKELAESMEPGTMEVQPSDHVSLADQVRSLQAAGDRLGAIDLVRAQTGMTADEADCFLTSLDPF